MLARRIVAGLCAAALSACGGGTPPAASPATTATHPATAAPSTATPSTAPTLPATPEAELTLVAIGDSIPYNAPQDCPGCIGFVDQYAAALQAATAKTVAVVNNSEHNNNTVEPLLVGLTSQQNRIEAVANADAIIVGIAHNDVPMNRDDDACDGAFSEFPDWSTFTQSCIDTEVARFTPTYEALFERVAELRAGKPTILRTINRYNDWNGWPGHDLSSKGLAATTKVIAAWNDMICAAAEANGFLCADISTAFNGEDGTTPSGDLLAGDYTHPSQKGNDTIAEVLIDLGFAPLVQ